MLLYLSLFTIVVSLALIAYNWNSNKNVVYFSYVFILTSLFAIAHYYMVFGNSRFWLAVFYNNFAPFMFLIGPFLFFYVRNTLNDSYSLSKKDWIHFIPATIALIGTIPYLFQPFEKKLLNADKIIRDFNAIREIEVNLFYTAGQSFALRTSMAFMYLLYCVYLLWKSYPSGINEHQIPKKQFLTTYRWLVILNISLFFIFINFTILSLKSSVSIPSQTVAGGYELYLFAGFAYSLMSFSIFLFPQIVYGIPRNTALSAPKNNLENSFFTPEEDPFFDLSNAILTYLEEKKPFLNPNFGVNDMAAELKMPQNHVRYCIARVIETNFSKLKSEFRINHALELLKKESDSKLRIESIGTESGFRTHSHFYAAFKEETGLTPSEYLNQLK